MGDSTEILQKTRNNNVIVVQSPNLVQLFVKPPCNPAIPLLGIHSEEIQTEKDTCTPMFTVVLLKIARTWKQPGCPSTGDG